MLLAPLVVGESGPAEGLHQRLAVDPPRRRRPRARSPGRPTPGRSGPRGRRPPRRAARRASSSSATSGRSAARPRSGSARARRRISATSASVSGWRVRTRRPDSSAALTSNEGFSVVAPISVTVPSSTAGSRASCWALLKRWISSMNRTVDAPPSRLAGLGDRLAQLLHPGEDGRERDEPGARSPGEQAGERRLARARAAPRGSARAAPSRLDQPPEVGPRRGGGPGRRTRPASGPHPLGQRGIGRVDRRRGLVLRLVEEASGRAAWIADPGRSLGRRTIDPFYAARRAASPPSGRAARVRSAGRSGTPRTWTFPAIPDRLRVGPGFGVRRRAVALATGWRVIAPSGVAETLTGLLVHRVPHLLGARPVDVERQPEPSVVRFPIRGHPVREHG